MFVDKNNKDKKKMFADIFRNANGKRVGLFCGGQRYTRTQNLFNKIVLLLAPVRDLFEKSGFYKYVQKYHFYPTIRDAVAIARKRQNA